MQERSLQKLPFFLLPFSFFPISIGSCESISEKMQQEKHGWSLSLFPSILETNTFKQTSKKIQVQNSDIYIFYYLW